MNKHFEIENFIVYGETFLNDFVEISWLDLMELMIAAPKNGTSYKFKLLAIHMIKVLSETGELPDTFLKNK